MHTIIIGLEFQKKSKRKYDADYIEGIIEDISHNPKIGKKIQAVNNIYLLDIGYTKDKKHKYQLVYYYQGKNTPLFIITIFKKKEKDLLSKIISSLIIETSARI